MALFQIFEINSEENARVDVRRRTDETGKRIVLIEQLKELNRTIGPTVAYL